MLLHHHNQLMNTQIPSDDDLIHLMKSHYSEIPHFKEWQSRSYYYFPLWKSRAEFISIFEELDGARLLKISDPDIYEEIEKFLLNEGIECMQSPFAVKIKLATIVEKDEIYIKIGDKVINYVKLNVPTLQDVYKDESFKYVFVNKKYLEKKDELIEKIKGFLGKLLKSVNIKVEEETIS